MPNPNHRIGIIGAGLSGLMAGRILQDRGIDVTLFDKGRRPGGRANTREHGPYRFDHGAQFFTVRSPVIGPFLASWIDAGMVAEWAGSLVRIEGGNMEPAEDFSRYVGVPGMIALPSMLAQGQDIRVNTRVESLRREDQGWALFGDGGSELGRFDRVLVALPAPQAADLLDEAQTLRGLAESTRMAPCWSGMYVFERPLSLGFDGAFLSDHPLSWVARDSSKPGRPKVEAWVLHAGPDWTKANLRMERTEAAMALLREFEKEFGPLPDIAFQRAHRWAFALASDPLPVGDRFDAEGGIGICGDWCVGGRVEGALLSGKSAADWMFRGPTREIAGPGTHATRY